MSDNSLFCTALCSGEHQATHLSTICLEDHQRCLQQQGRCFQTQAKELQAPLTFTFVWWSKVSDKTTTPLGYAPDKAGTVLAPQNMADLNQMQNRTCTTVAEQPCLGATLTNSCVGWTSLEGPADRRGWVHSPFERTQLLRKLQMETLGFLDPGGSGSPSTDKLSGDVLTVTL